MHSLLLHAGLAPLYKNYDLTSFWFFFSLFGRLPGFDVRVHGQSPVFVFFASNSVCCRVNHGGPLPDWHWSWCGKHDQGRVQVGRIERSPRHGQQERQGVLASHGADLGECGQSVQGDSLACLGTLVHHHSISIDYMSHRLLQFPQVTREAQDQLAAASHQKATKAIKAGKFKDEIVSVTTKVVDPATKEEREVTVSTDDGVRGSTTAESLAGLKSAFKKDGGTTTAGNASQVSDGAAASLIMTRAMAQKLGLPILGVFRSFAVSGVPPEVMGIGPAFAIPDALKKVGLSINDIDVFEVNEAFASQALYCAQVLKIPAEKLNPNGGAIALGHPLGATGARMTVRRDFQFLTELSFQIA
jgi:hypothetical protein